MYILLILLLHNEKTGTQLIKVKALLKKYQFRRIALHHCTMESHTLRQPKKTRKTKRPRPFYVTGCGQCNYVFSIINFDIFKLTLIYSTLVTNVIGSRCVSVPEPSSCLYMFIFLLTAEVNK